MAPSFDPSRGSAEKRVVPQANPAAGGERVDVWGEAGCNDLFGGYRASGSLHEASIAIENQELKAPCYDFSVLLELASAHSPRCARRARILVALRKAAHQLSRFDEDEAREARELLQPEITGGSPPLFISATGQAHLDLAWHWPLRETIRKRGRTFGTVLALMDRYPDYVFGASQPHLYHWMKDAYPALYQGINTLVREGRWEAQGARCGSRPTST
jgi:alpha-mannosidase